jgi:hypothetical protein
LNISTSKTFSTLPVTEKIKSSLFADAPHNLKPTRNRFLDIEFVLPDGQMLNREHDAAVINTDQKHDLRVYPKLAQDHLNVQKHKAFVNERLVN